MSEDAGIELRTVATLALIARLSNHSASSHSQSACTVLVLLQSQVCRVFSGGDHSHVDSGNVSLTEPTKINFVEKILLKITYIN